jgi:hypothetical protein
MRAGAFHERLTFEKAVMKDRQSNTSVSGGRYAI